MVGWVEARQAARVAGRGEFAGPPQGGVPLAGWLGPVIVGLKLLGKRDKSPSASVASVRAWIPLLIVLAPLLAFGALGDGRWIHGAGFLLPAAMGIAYLWRKGALGR